MGHAARRLTSIEFSFYPCNIYRDGPRGVGYPADARSVGDSHPSCCHFAHYLTIGPLSLSLVFSNQFQDAQTICQKCLKFLMFKWLKSSQIAPSFYTKFQDNSEETQRLSCRRVGWIPRFLVPRAFVQTKSDLCDYACRRVTGTVSWLIRPNSHIRMADG